MSDLLSTVYRCDLCADEKERREFVFIADETNHLSVCKDCEIFIVRTEQETSLCSSTI